MLFINFSTFAVYQYCSFPLDLAHTTIQFVSIITFLMKCVAHHSFIFFFASSNYVFWKIEKKNESDEKVFHLNGRECKKKNVEKEANMISFLSIHWMMIKGKYLLWSFHSHATHSFDQSTNRMTGCCYHLGKCSFPCF